MKKELQHHCKELRPDDVKIKYDKINMEECSWILEQTWYATKCEVDEGLAEIIGDAISTHRLLISYCPCCGENLTKIKINTWNS